MGSELYVHDYMIAWIAALPIERASALRMLDEEHKEPDDFQRHPNDANFYDWGRMHNHNIVLTSLPASGYGKVNAANTVGELLASLPHIKFGFMVGIGAGIPGLVTLGDVVVGLPDKTHGGVVQYDLGKAGNHWEPKGVLRPPPDMLMKALSKLQAEHESAPPRLQGFLNLAYEKNPYWAAKYARPSTYSSAECSPNATLPIMHFGTIASGDTVVKDVGVRNMIASKVDNCLCIEMEAAGLLNKFPCIVIRGICDFADANKNDDWQRYSSATAAACAKEILLYVPKADIDRTQTARDLMLHGSYAQASKAIRNHGKERIQSDEAADLLRSLDKCPYIERKNRNMEALPGTCEWFLQHPHFFEWLSKDKAALLWVTADPGTGKSVLARHLIDQVLPKSSTICYFFFKEDFVDQKSSADAMCAILRQLFLQVPSTIGQALMDFKIHNESYMTSFRKLWSTFLKVSKETGPIICVFDALDECQRVDRGVFVESVIQCIQEVADLNLKILITSRGYAQITDHFHDVLLSQPTIRLSGESEAAAERISQEIDIVIRHRLERFGKMRGLSHEEQSFLLDRFLSTQHRTYLWAHLTMHVIESRSDFTQHDLQNIMETIPKSVSDAYDKMLASSRNIQRMYTVLDIVLAAQRPLSTRQTAISLAIAEHTGTSLKDLHDYIVPETRFRSSLTDLCGLMVVVNDGHVYFLHQTVREFLVKERKRKRLIGPEQDSFIQGIYSGADSPEIARSHSLLATICARFMLSIHAPWPEWLLPLNEGEGRVGYVRQDNTEESELLQFLQYCFEYWPYHFRQNDLFGATKDDAELALQVLVLWTSLFCSAPVMFRRLHRFQHGSACHVRNIIGLASHFGFTSVSHLLLTDFAESLTRRDCLSWDRKPSSQQDGCECINHSKAGNLPRKSLWARLYQPKN